MRLPRTWPALACLAAACFGPVSPDIPLALAWGRAIADAGALPATNVLSAVHADHPVLLDKWAFQLGVYGAFNLGGWPVLVALQVALLSLALAGALAVARGATPRGGTGPLAVLLALALLHRAHLRAELCTLAALAGVLALLPRLAAGRRGAWVALALLQVVWANTHGYFVLGPVACAAASLGEAALPWLARRGAGRRVAPRPGAAGRLAVAAVLATLASAATPYGLATLAHPVRLAAELVREPVLRTAVGDFGRPWEIAGTWPEIAGLGLLCAVPLAALRCAATGRLDGRSAALAALALVVAWPAARNLPVAVLLALPMLARAAALPPPAWRRVAAWRVASGGSGPALAAAAVGAFLAGAGAMTDLGRRVPGFAPPPHAWSVAAADALAALPLATPGRPAGLWNDLTSGGWLAWRLGPGRIAMDGNTDGYPLDALADYRATLEGERDVRDAAARIGATRFHARPDHPAHRLVLARLATDPGLAVVHWSPHGAVCVARDAGGVADPTAEAAARAACAAWAGDVAALEHEARARRAAGVSAADAPLAARAARLHPYAPGIRDWAARTAAAANDLPAARFHAEALAWLRPSDGHVAGLLGDCRAAVGDRPGARAAFARAVDLLPAGDARLAARDALAALGRDGG